MSPHKSQDYKLSAVKYYLKSKNASETCRVFECSSQTLIFLLYLSKTFSN